MQVIGGIGVNNLCPIMQLFGHAVANPLHGSGQVQGQGFKTTRNQCLPCQSLATPDDQPDRAIAHRVSRVGAGRHRIAGGVRMIMPDHRHTSGPRPTVRGEQRGGINFEFPLRVQSHVGARLRRLDSSVRSEQQPANLAFRRSVRVA